MNKILSFIIFLVSFLFSQGNIFLFDMGSDDSPCMENFIRITEKDIYEKGKTKYGWEGKNGLSMNQNFSEYGVGDLDLDPLLCDFVKSRTVQPLIFTIDVPKGKYNIAIFVGQLYSGKRLLPPEIWYTSNYIKVNEKIVYQKEINFEKYVKWFFSKFEDDFLPGDSLFEKYVLPYYQIINTTTETEVEKIRIEFSKGIAVNGILIYPEENKEQLTEKIKEILNFSKKYVDEKFKFEIEKKEGILSKKYTEDFLIYPVPYYKEILPFSKPEEKEINTPVKKFSSKGQIVIISFGLVPLKDLRDVEIRISDLISESGDKISKENASIFLCRYIPKKLLPDKYSIEGWYATKYKKMDLTSGITRKFIVFINKIPENKKEGTYKGEIIVKTKGAMKKLPVELKILPFKLDEPDIYLGMYTKYPRNPLFRFVNTEDEDFIKFNDYLMEKILKEMKELGFNWACIEMPWYPFKIREDGKVEPTSVLQRWEKILSFYKKYFPKAPFILYGGLIPGLTSFPNDEWRKKGFTEDVKKNMKLIIGHLADYYKEEMKEREIAIYISDELSNRGLEGGKFGEQLASLYKESVKGTKLKLLASMNGIPEHLMIPYLDYPTINYEFPITEETIDKIKKAGGKLCFYNIGNNRFSYGYYIFKTHPFGRLQWNFGPEHDVFYNIPCLPTLGHLRYSLILDSDLEMGKRMDVVSVAEGIIDYRYCLTLKNLIDKNKDTDDKKLKETINKAEDFLNYITNSIKTDIRYYAKETEPWSDETCEKIRLMIANYIKEIEYESKK
jgi:hypothetical protein